MDEIGAPLYGRLYKEEDGSLVPWSVIDSDANINCFTWSNKDTNLIVPRGLYNKEFNKCQGHVYIGQFWSYAAKEKSKK